ncbi:variable surface lipoprotein [Mycoplasmopsis bovirhinis]|nr:variable surface lipoprotein [Mycoplasmopsis bovirhinis]
MKINKKLISLSISISLLTPLIALSCTAKVTKKPNKPSDKATEQKEK